MAPTDAPKAAKERACSASVLRCLKEYLDTAAPFGVVIEDDAILDAQPLWLHFTYFDLFFPFFDNRYSSPFGNASRSLICGSIPRDGTFAMLFSRRMATAWRARLADSLWIADAGQRSVVAEHREWLIGSYAGNIVTHDGSARSLIDDQRQRAHATQAVGRTRSNRWTWSTKR